MKKIFLYWYKLKDGSANFGDELGPYIVSRLSGIRCVFIKPIRKFIFLELFESLFKKQSDYNFKDLVNIISGKRRILITAGSVLNHFNIKNCDIWGSGIITRNEKVPNANFYALRGEFSQLRIRELGYKVPNVLGDPALLLPLVYPVNVSKKYKLGIIPHYIHYEKVKAKFNTETVLVINLLDSIEDVINEINACQSTISSSLHGIIVSHAYNVPSLWYELSDKALYGDNIKFADYFSSVAVKTYEPFLIPKINESEDFIEKITNHIRSEKSINSIQNDLRKIQTSLLKAAPFQVKREFF
ncbi:polysaccharide pyruvyl transferase family protein [Aureibaculum luteum]|uniref:polysaccharide pyruvyl transferase family protein n=1 Tax=Aureibaculum luteum TaxID=1548456 RepID=UPI000E4C1FC4|nr:polysaccharide pyruvyl transferase family protein [Aureibaculum luteum]